MFFSQDKQEELRKANPDKKTPQISKLVSQEFKKLSEDELK